MQNVEVGGKTFNAQRSTLNFQLSTSDGWECEDSCPFLEMVGIHDLPWD
jgi:hypothetical protein